MSENKYEIQIEKSSLKPEEIERRVFLALSQLIIYEDLNSNLKKYEKRKRIKKG